MQRVNTIDISNVLQLEKTLSTLLNKMISSKLDLENWLKRAVKSNLGNRRTIKIALHRLSM